MSVYYNIYEKKGERMLAACDESLLGETFEEGNMVLDVTESFYGGEIIEAEELKDKFAASTIANLVGEESVKTALEEGFGFEENVLKIEDIPHLQIVRM